MNPPRSTIVLFAFLGSCLCIALSCLQLRPIVDAVAQKQFDTAKKTWRDHGFDSFRKSAVSIGITHSTAVNAHQSLSLVRLAPPAPPVQLAVAPLSHSPRWAVFQSRVALTVAPTPHSAVGAESSLGIGIELNVSTVHTRLQNLLVATPDHTGHKITALLCAQLIVDRTAGTLVSASGECALDIDARNDSSIGYVHHRWHDTNNTSPTPFTWTLLLSVRAADDPNLHSQQFPTLSPAAQQLVLRRLFFFGLFLALPSALLAVRALLSECTFAVTLR